MTGSANDNEADTLAFFRRVMLAGYQVDFTDSLFGTDAALAEADAAEFCNLLYHQGDIYPESVEAVPHLVAAFDFSLPGVQAEWIYVLGGIATAQRPVRGDEALVRDGAVAVHRHWARLEECLSHAEPVVRKAALLTLTDLARINLPQMRFTELAPFVGALPEGVVGGERAEGLLASVAAQRSAFDNAWAADCDFALALLAFEGDPSRAPTGASPDWAMLARH